MTDLVEKAREILKNNGSRWTKQRRQMIEILVQHPNYYIDITDVDRELRKTYPGLSHDTIYRNFKEFEALEIVEIRQHGDQMQVKWSCDDAHHHHFICDRCGRVQEIKLPPIDYGYLAKQLPGAQISSHSFELHGICAECMASQEKHN